MVRKCGHLNPSIGQCPEEDGLGKSSQIDAADTDRMNRFPCLRCRCGNLNDPLKLGNQGRTETLPLLFIELDRLQILALRFEYETVTHRSNARAFNATSSSETILLSLASEACTRRADSSPHT